VYFVTMKRAGYCLFSVSPSERFGVGLLDDQQRVHVLERDGADYVVRKEWPIAQISHTDIMLRLGGVAEPASAAEFVRLAQGA
jgi:YD repeat-containing protein